MILDYTHMSLSVTDSCCTASLIGKHTVIYALQCSCTILFHVVMQDSVRVVWSLGCSNIQRHEQFH